MTQLNHFECQNKDLLYYSIKLKIKLVINYLIEVMQDIPSNQKPTLSYQHSISLNSFPLPKQRPSFSYSILHKTQIKACYNHLFTTPTIASIIKYL